MVVILVDWSEGWAFAHFGNERSLFLSKKWAIWKIAHFCSFPLFERAKKQGWAIAHFENERSLIFLSDKWAIWEIACFLLIFSLSLFLKERKSNWASDRSFEKSKWANDHSFALLQWANEQAIAHLLFYNEQMSNKLLNRSFTMSEWATNCSIALLQWVEVSNERMSDCPRVGQLLIRSFSHHSFPLFSKE